MLLSGPIFALQQQQAVPLPDILKLITVSHKVNFLYEESSINGKKLLFDASDYKKKTVEETLNALLPGLKLEWYKVDDKNYAIYNALIKDTVVANKEIKKDTIKQLATIGREQQLISVRPDSLKNVRLNEVNITASRPVVTSKSDRFLFDVSNSAMASGNSIQLLKIAPFVKISSDNTITLQGKATMILIDNKPVAESSLQNILQTLPAGNIAQIELITHPSAKYDAAYGAVINIITKKSKIEGLTGSVQLDGYSGQYATGSSSASLTYKHKGLTLYDTSGLRYGDDYFAVDESRTVGFNDKSALLTNDWTRVLWQTTGSFHFGADLELGKGQSIGLIADANLMHFKGPWDTNNTFKETGAARADSTLLTNATFEQPVFMGNFNLNYHLTADSGRNELSVLTTYTPFRRDLKQNFPSVLTDADGKLLSVPPLYHTTNLAAIDVYIAQADYVHAFNEQWKMETGLKYQQSQSSNEITYEQYNGTEFLKVPKYSSDNQLEESISGAYAMITRDLKKDKFQAGIRTEYTQAAFVGNFKQNYFNIFPTFYYQHNLNDQRNVSFSYKRTISRAPYYELVPYAVFLNKYTVEQGNPSLRPAYDNIFSIGTNIDKLNISISYTATKGMKALFPVRADADTKLTYFSRRNLDKAYDYSMYLFFPLSFTNWWESQNSGTPLGYNRAEGTVLESDYARAAFHSDFRSSNIFKVSKGIKLQVDLYYWTKYVQDLTNFSGYKNVDAAIVFDLFSAKAQLRLGGEQLIFKRNDYEQYRSFDSYQIDNKVYTDSRRVSIGFTYKFGKTSMKSPEKKLGNEEALKRLN